MMANVIVVILLAVIIGGAVSYLIKAKKSGAACIGCPSGGACAVPKIEKKKFQKSNEAFLVSKRDNYRCMGEFMSSNLFFQGMMYLTVLVAGGYLISIGEMAVI